MNNKKLTKIFIVEDNKTFTAALRADIESSFYNEPIAIFSYLTGEACIADFKKEKPQIVLLDYHLNTKEPDAANGLAVLDWIKKENNSTFVVMLTSEDDIDIALKSFKHGACDYVVKSATLFRKVFYSLFNIIKIMEAKREAKRYRYIAIGVILCIALLVGGVIAVSIFSPVLIVN
ncbi:MAG: response regulator [Bacteroidetes bacterium]|nr:response regulator [Bacteroidota bacterium]MBU1719351.1 response regulator [Bacteroidota bacterium]